MNDLSWADFEKVKLVAGTIYHAESFPEAKKPAIKVFVDFGDYGKLKTSAQIANQYAPTDLIGMQIVAVINFPPKQIGPFMSEFLLTGFPTSEGVVLTTTHKPVPNGTRLA